MEEFARKEYKSYILVDFSKVNPQVMEFFNLYLDDLDMLFMNLELYFRRKLRSCFEFLQKVFLGLMYLFSCVLWAIFWSFPLLFFVR